MDEIFLKPDPENDCFYHGSLKGDIESEVEVDGCKNDAEIVEISSRLVPCGLVILLLENGKTFAINPLEGIGFPNSTDAVPQVAAGFNGRLGKEDFPQLQLPKFTSGMTEASETCSVPIGLQERKSKRLWTSQESGSRGPSDFRWTFTSKSFLPSTTTAA